MSSTLWFILLNLVVLIFVCLLLVPDSFLCLSHLNASLAWNILQLFLVSVCSVPSTLQTELNTIMQFCLVSFRVDRYLIAEFCYLCSYFSILSLLFSIILSLVFHSLEHVLICKYGFLLNLCFLFTLLFWLLIFKYDASLFFSCSFCSYHDSDFLHVSL